MNLRGKTIFVTGGTGFLGGRLVERLVLEHGADVRVLVRNFGRAVRIARFPVQMVPGSTTDREAVRRAAKGCELIFHCAYGVAANANQQKVEALESAEIVAAAALECRAARLVHVSTFSVYGEAADGELDESAPYPASRDVYTESKQEIERRLMRLHQERQLPVAIVQPTVVYGPWAGVWTVRPVQLLKNRRVVLLNGGSGICNAVYVDDVIDGMLLAATRAEVVGEVFLLSGDGTVTWKEFFAAYEQMLGFASTVCLSAGEASAELARQRQARGTLRQLRRAIHSQKLHKRLRRLPLVAKLTSDGFWDKLARPALETAEKPLWIPDLTQFHLFASRARVRIDKARVRLGYAPRYDLNDGMELTQKWVEWANLIEH